MQRFFDYIYIALTVGFTVYGQLVLRWRISKFGALPEDSFAKLKFLLLLFLDPFIFSGFMAAFAASLAWMAAMTKFELSHAYPFMSLNFVIVLLLGYLLLNEPITTTKACGIFLIVVGTVVAARG